MPASGRAVGCVQGDLKVLKRKRVRYGWRGAVNTVVVVMSFVVSNKENLSF